MGRNADKQKKNNSAYTKSFQVLALTLKIVFKKRKCARSIAGACINPKHLPHIKELVLSIYQRDLFCVLSKCQ